MRGNKRSKRRSLKYFKVICRPQQKVGDEKDDEMATPNSRRNHPSFIRDDDAPPLFKEIRSQHD
jgi:hypothetical protein